MNTHHRFGGPGTGWRRGIAAAVALSLLCACAHRSGQVAPIPLPAVSGEHINVQGARIAATAYTDPDQAEAAFGFDIRGAGILPVRLALDNQGVTVVKIDPQQTFLIDRSGQAWPLLTAEQAYNRAAKAQELGQIVSGGAASAAMLGTVGAITGFALAVVLSRGIATPVAQGAIAGAAVGALTGGAASATNLEDQVRADLSKKAMRNQRVLPGEMAYGVFFFPGRDEARSARGLRLALELDGYPHIVNLPLQTLPPNQAH